MLIELRLIRPDDCTIGVPGIEHNTRIHSISSNPVGVSAVVVVPETTTVPNSAREVDWMLQGVRGNPQVCRIRQHLPVWARKILPISESVQYIPDGILNSQIQIGRAHV